MTHVLTENVSCSALHPKTTDKANAFRFEGNEAFKRHQLEESLELYSMSLLHAIPQTRAHALALGNRSAATYELKELEATCRDISRCFEQPTHACDKELRDKLRRRMLECESKAMHERKEIKAKLKTNDPKGVQRRLDMLLPQPVFRRRNTALPSCSAAITIHEIENKGRGYIATEDIPAGSLLIRETALASLLSKNLTSLLCHHCFQPLPPDWLPCDYCSNSNYRFCTLKCRDSAWYAYHDFECANDIDVYVEDADTDDSDVAAKYMMATRILVQANDEELARALFGEVAVQDDAVAVNGTTKTTETAESATANQDPPNDAVESLTIEEQGPPGIKFGSDFSSFFSLYGEADSRRLPKLFNDILRRLTNSPKFESLFDESIDDLDRLSAVEHLFRVVLGKLGRNMHGMLPLFEPTRHPRVSTVHDSLRANSSSVAVGMFPQQAICNHSCTPNVTSTHVGTTVEVRAMRDISVGEELVQSYGPRYGESMIEQRQAILQQQYLFDCDCHACNDKEMIAQETSLSAFVCPACKKPTARITCSEEDGTPRLLCETCKKESSCDEMLRAGATVDTILNNVEVETSNFDRGLQLDKVMNFLPALTNHFGAHNVTYIENVRRSAQCMLSHADHGKHAAQLYDQLLAHVEKFFSKDSEQYEAMLFEAVMAYGAADRCSENMLTQCKLALRLLMNQTGVKNSRTYVAMRFGLSGTAFFDDIFSAFGDQFAQLTTKGRRLDA